MVATPTVIDRRDKAELQSALSQIQAQCRARPVLFGSRARGDARRTSDIDIALVSEKPIPPHLLAEARQMLDESHVPFRVDLVDYATASAPLRHAIDREGIEWPM